MMLRLRNPGGEVPGKLFLVLDELSDKLGNGTLRPLKTSLSNAWNQKENLKEVIQTIVNSMGSTLAACGDTIETLWPLQLRLIRQTIILQEYWQKSCRSSHPNGWPRHFFRTLG